MKGLDELLEGEGWPPVIAGGKEIKFGWHGKEIGFEDEDVLWLKFY